MKKSKNDKICSTIITQVREDSCQKKSNCHTYKLPAKLHALSSVNLGFQTEQIGRVDSAIAVTIETIKGIP